MPLTHALTHSHARKYFPFFYFHLGKEAQQAKGKSNTRALIEMCSVKVEKKEGQIFTVVFKQTEGASLINVLVISAQHNYHMPRASVSQSYFKCQSAGEGDTSLAGDIQEQGSCEGCTPHFLYCTPLCEQSVLL